MYFFKYKKDHDFGETVADVLWLQELAAAAARRIAGRCGAATAGHRGGSQEEWDPEVDDHALGPVRQRAQALRAAHRLQGEGGLCIPTIING